MKGTVIGLNARVDVAIYGDECISKKTGYNDSYWCTYHWNQGSGWGRVRVGVGAGLRPKYNAFRRKSAAGDWLA